MSESSRAPLFFLPTRVDPGTFGLYFWLLLTLLLFFGIASLSNFLSRLHDPPPAVGLIFTATAECVRGGSSSPGPPASRPTQCGFVVCHRFPEGLEEDFPDVFWLFGADILILFGTHPCPRGLASSNATPADFFVSTVGVFYGPLGARGGARPLVASSLMRSYV